MGGRGSQVRQQEPQAEREAAGHMCAAWEPLAAGIDSSGMVQGALRHLECKQRHVIVLTTTASQLR